MEDIYVVSDIHGNYEMLRKALFAAGILDNHGQKASRCYVVQIGDLANCVRDSVEGDLACLNEVGKTIDLMCVGNHEIPYFDNGNKFAGFAAHLEVGNKLRQLRSDGLLRAAYVIDDILVTHAGVTREQLNISTGNTATSVASKLNREWSEQNYGYHLFRDCGAARYGTDPLGGILWCDFRYEFEPTDFPQIVGHSPGLLRMKGNTICIDTGAKNGNMPTVLKVS